MFMEQSMLACLLACLLLLFVSAWGVYFWSREWCYLHFSSMFSFNGSQREVDEVEKDVHFDIIA